jgi:lipopolysaccharide transport system ATP-binding protein
MYMRLAFAVAAHLEPDVLIVDEVLAVGDAEFQKKCLGKMQTVAEAGRTVLFVSHDMSAISTLTQKGLFLDKGTVKYFGDTDGAIKEYIKNRKQQDFIYRADSQLEKPCLTRVEVITSEENNVHSYGKPLEIQFDLYMPETIEGVGLNFQIRNALAKPIAASWTYKSAELGFNKKGAHTIRAVLPNPRLYLGEYSLTVGLANEKGPENYEYLTDLCPFEVQMFGVMAQHPLGWIPEVCAYVEDCEWSR